jgi:hypothetical protein
MALCYSPRGTRIIREIPSHSGPSKLADNEAGSFVLCLLGHRNILLGCGSLMEVGRGCMIHGIFDRMPQRPIKSDLSYSLGFGDGTLARYQDSRCGREP